MQARSGFKLKNVSKFSFPISYSSSDESGILG
jgi:hypothetical protein